MSRGIKISNRPVRLDRKSLFNTDSLEQKIRERLFGAGDEISQKIESVLTEIIELGLEGLGDVESKSYSILALADAFGFINDDKSSESSFERYFKEAVKEKFQTFFEENRQLLETSKNPHHKHFLARFCRNINEAINFCREAIEEGNETSAELMFELGKRCFDPRNYRHFRGYAYEDDRHKAFKCYQMSSGITNSPDALYELALCYEYGVGVEQNQEYANRVYRLSADQESFDAQLKLATDLRLQNQSDSLRYYIKALMNDAAKDRIEEVIENFMLIPTRDKIQTNPLSCDEIISAIATLARSKNLSHKLESNFISEVVEGSQGSLSLTDLHRISCVYRAVTGNWVKAGCSPFEFFYHKQTEDEKIFGIFARKLESFLLSEGFDKAQLVGGKMNFELMDDGEVKCYFKNKIHKSGSISDSFGGILPSEDDYQYRREVVDNQTTITFDEKSLNLINSELIERSNCEKVTSSIVIIRNPNSLNTRPAERVLKSPGGQSQRK